jgi:hypothetical protein
VASIEEPWCATSDPTIRMGIERIKDEPFGKSRPIAA